MKLRLLNAASLSFPLACALTSLLAGQFASAASIYWDGASASWNTNTNWSTASGADTPDPGAVPGALDDAIFNITTVNGAETITLDANQAARGLTFNNTDTTTLTGGGTARTLTLGVGGMTMAASAGAVTLGDNTAGNDVLISLAAGAQAWTNNHASNAFTINNTVSSISRVTGATLTFNQASTGLFSINTTSLPNDATGIIGRWGFFGTGGTQRYAVNNAGTIEGYSGGTGAATANDFGIATTNYDLTTAAVTLTGSRTANTFRSAGAGGAIDLGASGTNTLTANGILAVGSGTLTVQRTGGTGTVVVGSSNELLIAGSQAVTISAPISGTSKTLTYSGTNTLTLSGANTWTGSLNVNSGTLQFNSPATNGNNVTTFVATGAIYNYSNGFSQGAALSNPFTVNGTFNKSGNGSITFNSGATLSGTGSVSLSGQTTLTMNADNTAFTGTITDTIAGGGGSGTIFGHAGAFGAGTFVFNTSNTISSSVANLTNANVTALTFTADASFTGSNSMNLGTGAVTLSGGNRILTVTGVTLTLGGAVGQDVAGRQLTKAGTGALVLTGSSGYSGATVISAGNLNLGGSTATGSLTSPTLTLGGGTFSYTRTGTNAQSFTTTNFNSAPANVLTVASGNTLNLGNIVRGAGVTYDFSTIPGGGTVAANVSNNSAAGIMSTSFTYGANSWAVANGPGVAISAFSGYTQTSGAGTTAGNYTGVNIDVDNSAGTLSGGITANSIRFNTAAANTLSLTGANVISSGGILVGSGVGANLSTIAGGTLTGPASGALTIWQNNTSDGLTISSNIINNTATTLDKFGAGTLTLSGTNTYTGATTIYGGTLAVSGGAAIANTGLVTLANTAGVIFQLNSNETIGNLSGGGTTGGTVALQGNTLTLGDGTAQTYGGNFTGTSGSGIIKQGSGTLTLSNATSIPGTLTINAGTALFSLGNLSGGTITLNGSPSSIATLDMRFSSAATPIKGTAGLGGGIISNPIVLGSSVTTTGARLFTSTGDGSWNFTGGITGAAGATQTLILDTRSGTINGGDRTTTTISGVIANGTSGTLSLNFNISPQTGSTGSNNHPTYVNLTGINTFTGTLTAARTNTGATSWLTIGGEHWANGSFGANTPTYGREGTGYLAGPGNDGNFTSAINFGGTAGQIVNLAYFSSANQTLSGVIGGSGANGALVKEGSGTLTLTNANLYNRLTTIGGGTLLLGFDTTINNILPSTTPLFMGLGTTYNSDSNGGNASLTMTNGPSGGTLRLAGAAGSGTQTVASLTTAANTASSILVDANRTLTITSGTVTTGANSSLNFNTAAGGADASTSAVGTSIVAFGALPTFTSGFTVADSTGFGLAMVNGSNQVIRNISTALLPDSLASSATDYRINNNGGGSGAAGSSTLTISASQSAKSITVDTTGGSGVLTLNSGVVLSNNIWNFGGSNNYQITGSAGGAGLRSVNSADTFVINNYNTGTVTFSSPFLANGVNAFVVNGIGTTVLGGANTYTGATSITGGTLRVTGNLVAAYNAAITISTGATFRYSSGTGLTLGTSANITGGGGLTLDGGQNLTLQGGTSTWSGPTLVSGNNSRLTVGNVAGSLSPNTYITIAGNGSGGGQLYNSVASTTVANNFTISGVGFAEADAQSNFIGAIRSQGTTLSGTITLAGNSRIGSFGNTTNTISGRITGGFGIDFWGMVSANNQVPTFVLSNTNNNYTGNTTIYASQLGTNNPTGTGTTLKLGASNVIPDGASADNVVFALNGTNSGGSTATLDLNGFNETINGLAVNTGTFATRITNTAAATSASVLTIGANDTTSSFSGTITDSGAGRTLALTKIGSGILTLSGINNSYIGATTVSAGTLAVTGSLGATAVSVNAGTLSGNGSFGGNVSIASGANHAIAVAATAGAQDTTVITGTLTLTSGNILDLTAASTPATGVYELATATTIIGTPTTINYNGISGTVTVDTSGSPHKLLLTVGVASPYSTWASTFLPSDVSNPALNFDSDTLTNLQEFAFGTNPTSSTGSLEYVNGGAVTTPGSPILLAEGGTYYAVFGRRTTYVADGLTYNVQFSADLSSPWVTSGVTPTVLTTSGAIEAVSVPFPGLIATDSGPQKARFFRVEVLLAP